MQVQVRRSLRDNGWPESADDTVPPFPSSTESSSASLLVLVSLQLLGKCSLIHDAQSSYGGYVPQHASSLPIV